MTAETDFRAALVTHAPLVALVAQRVVQNGVDVGTTLPYVVFVVSHTPLRNLLGTKVGDQVTFTAEAWATGALAADAVADAIEAALTANAPGAATVIDRTTGFDADQGLDATVLAVEWWA